MSEAERLNLGLVRLHRVFFLFYVVVATVLMAYGLNALMHGKGDGVALAFVEFVFLAVIVAHWYAAKGAGLGKPYGRTISRVIGCCWVLGFPVGTALAVFVFSRTRKRSWKEGIASAAAENVNA